MPDSAQHRIERGNDGRWYIRELQSDGQGYIDIGSYDSLEDAQRASRKERGHQAESEDSN